MGIEGAVQAPTPVDAGSTLNAANSLLGLFGPQRSGGGSGGSENDRYGRLWADFAREENPSAPPSLATASMEQLTRFQALHPSAGSWAFNAAETVGNEARVQQEAQESAQATITQNWMTSPAGILAASQAQNLPQEEQERFLAIKQAEWITATADADRIARETAETNLNNVRREEIWQVSSFDLKAGASIINTTFIDAIEGLALNPGATINFDEVPELVAAFPALSGTVLNRDNAASVLRQVIDQFEEAQVRRIAGAYGLSPNELGALPADVRSNVFGQLEATLEFAEKRLDPAEIRKRVENEGFLAMVDAGVPLDIVSSISLATKGNPALQSSVLAALTQGTGNLMELYNSGAFAEARAVARSESADERARAFAGFAQLAKIYDGTSSVGSVYPEVNEAQRAVGFGSATLAALDHAVAEATVSGETRPLGPNFYSGNIEGKGASLDAAIAAQPSLEGEITTQLSSDFNTHFRSVNEKALGEGYQIVLGENDTLELVPSEETLATIEQLKAVNERIAAGEMGNPQDMEPIRRGNEAQIERLLNERPDINLREIQYKWSALTSAGKVGSNARTIAAAEFGFDIGDDVAAATRDALTTTAPETAGGGGEAAPSYVVTQSAQVAQSQGITAMLQAESSANLNGSQLMAAAIQSVESFGGDYNAFNRGNAGDVARGSLLEGRPLSEYTIGEIMALQDADKAFAVGAYQIIPTTLAEAVQSMGLTPDMPFNQVTQDRIFVEYLIGDKRPPIQRYLSGESDNLDAAVESLAQEFASFPSISRGGTSYYAGEGDNATKISIEEARRLLQTARERGLGPVGVGGGITTTPLPAQGSSTVAPTTSARPTARPAASGGGGTEQAPETSRRPQARPEREEAAGSEGDKAEAVKRIVDAGELSPAMLDELAAFIEELKNR